MTEDGTLELETFVESVTEGSVLEICCSNDGRELFEVKLDEELLLVMLKTMPVIEAVLDDPFVSLLLALEEVDRPIIVTGDEVLVKPTPEVVFVKLLSESFRLIIGRETLLGGCTIFVLVEFEALFIPALPMIDTFVGLEIFNGFD